MARAFQKVLPQPSKHNLIVKLTSFIGCETELEKLSEYLLVKKHSLVSIIGEGGVGKTRLALAMASQIVADSASAIRYPDGVWLISCVGISAGETAEQQLIASIGTTIGLTFQGATPILKNLMDYMHNRSALLILDNFEHLLSLPCLYCIGRGLSKAANPHHLCATASIFRVICRCNWKVWQFRNLA